MPKNINVLIKQNSSSEIIKTLTIKSYSQKHLLKALTFYIKGQGLQNEFEGSFKRGLCYGLSIVFSTMYNEGKHDWWIALLKNIIDNKHLLASVIYLEQLATDWNLPDSDTLQTHRQLIERVINYTLFSQCDLMLLPKWISPRKLLQDLTSDTYSQTKYLTVQTPLPPFFFQHEYLSRTSKLQTIQSSDIIAGYFDSNLLLTTIETQDIIANIVKIGNLNHACALVYNQQSNRYGFYNPSSTLGDAKWFTTKENLVAHIFERLGNIITITIASNISNKTFFRDFKQKIQQQEIAKKLLSNNATPIIYKFNKELADELFFNQEQKPAVFKLFINQLQQPNIDGYFNFILMLINAPKQQLRILKLNNDNSTLLELANLLPQKAKNHNTTLESLLYYSTQTLIYLIDSLQEYDELTDNLSLAMMKWPERQWQELSNGIKYKNQISQKIINTILNSHSQNIDADVYMKIKMIHEMDTPTSIDNNNETLPGGCAIL